MSHSESNPASGLKSPALRGTPAHLEALFGDAATTIETSDRSYALRYRSAEHWLQVWRSIYGPLQKAFDSLDENNQTKLATDLIALVNDCDSADDETMVVHSEYLEVVINKA